MSRWIAFDEESTAVAAAQSGLAVSFQRGDALETALASSKPAIVLLPGDSADQVLVVEIGPGPAAKAEMSPSSNAGIAGMSDEPTSYEATGFLGLVDEPVFDHEPVAKKRWWQRLLD